MANCDSKKAFIENLQSELRSALGSHIARDYENALRLVSEVVFTRSSGFVLEFIQNAEDAGFGLNNSGAFEVTLNRETIKIVHNGRPFSEEDVRALCGIQSSKRPEKGTLGYLGIGFKSVFKVTSCPQIYSNGFQFKFDRSHWPTNTALWRVIPIWVDDPSEPIDPALTTFIIPFRDTSLHALLAQELQNLGTELYLFLRWLKRISICDETTGQSRVLENLGETDGVTVLKRDGLLQRFKFFRKTAHVPEDVQQDELTREYRANVVQREIAVAFALDDNGNLEPTLAGAMYGGVYSFLPLGEASSGAKFPIQADFLVQPGRDAINYEAKWNHWLVEQVERLCREAVLHFKTHEKWRYQFLPMFAVESSSTEAFQQLFGPKLLKPLRDFLETESTIPTKTGEWAKPSELIRLVEKPQAVEGIQRLGLLQDDEIGVAFGDSPDLQLVHPSVRDGGAGGVNIPNFDRRDLLKNVEFLRRKAESEDAPNWFRLLYLWLQQNPEYSEDTQRRRPVRRIRLYHEYPIVLTSGTQLLNGGDVFLLNLPGSDPTIEYLAAQIASSKPLLHPDILGEASCESEQEELGGFLRGFTGVQVLDAVRVCQEALLPKINVTAPKPSADELLNWTGTCRRILTGNIPISTEIWVLDKGGDIRPASECLFGGEFSPQQDWETHQQYIPGMRFVSASYLGSNGLNEALQWRAFFAKCGVKDAPVNGVEEFAMHFAGEKLRSQFAKVIRVDKLNLGYDLSAEGGPKGEAIQVEVKGKSIDEDVDLTGNETRAADKYQDSFYLCVVGSIPNNPTMYMIKNPAKEGTKDKLTISPATWKSWKWAPPSKNTGNSPLKIGIRSKFDKTIVVYCDESCHNVHKFFVLGGVFFALKPRAEVDAVTRSIEAQLQAVKDKYGLATVKWVKVPTKDGKFFEGYKAYLREFLEAEGALFKCMIVDTTKYPLNNRKLWEGDALVGYMKFYCVFLSDGLMQRFPGHFYDIRIDQFEFRPGCDADTLEKTVEARFVKKKSPQPCLRYCSVQALDHRKHNLLQLADLLLGAVAFVWNAGMTRDSAKTARRKELVQMIQDGRHVDLCTPSAWSKHDFNIWLLEPNPRPSESPTTTI